MEHPGGWPLAPEYRGLGRYRTCIGTGSCRPRPRWAVEGAAVTLARDVRRSVTRILRSTVPFWRLWVAAWGSWLLPAERAGGDIIPSRVGKAQALFANPGLIAAALR